MGKSSNRRLKNIAKDLALLASKSESEFLRKWDNLVSMWLSEVERRGTLLRKGKPSEPVFGILEKAIQLLSLCGPEVEAIVGQQTREVIKHHSSKVVARELDSRLYQMINRNQYVKQ